MLSLTHEHHTDKKNRLLLLIHKYTAVTAKGNDITQVY